MTETVYSESQIGNPLLLRNMTISDNVLKD